MDRSLCCSSTAINKINTAEKKLTYRRQQILEIQLTSKQISKCFHRLSFATTHLGYHAPVL